MVLRVAFGGSCVGNPRVVSTRRIGPAHHDRHGRRKNVDSSGSVLPGVTISLKSPEALGDFTAVTDGGGAYRVTNLPPGTYSSAPSSPAFSR